MSTQTETPGGAAAEEPTEKKLSEEEFVRWIRSTPRSPDRDVVLTTPLTTPHARLKRIQRRYFEEVAKKFERQRMLELEWVAAIDNWCVLLVGALSHPDSQTLTRVVVRCARLLACSFSSYYGMPEMTIHGTVRLKRPPFIDQDLSVVTPRLIRDHVLIEVLNARMLKEFN